ncbi:glycosyltransferase family 2 protein [Amycolatopsis sp. NPDC059021]|uniref:glycosyltransferase family 2 protein n=1 Tax=Amycolatopsis sp. NPDC059021 TaxID=3346704 RepID=UPI00366FCBB9
MTAPRITVVIITHNRRRQLMATLARMTALPDAAPIILVDNGSTDGTAEAVADTHPDVRLIHLQENIGAVARNVAVRQVRTPYVAFCDDDTSWQPGSLTVAADTLDRYPALAAVIGRCLLEPDLAEDPVIPGLRASPVPGPAWLPGPALLSLLAGLSAFRVAAFTDAGGFSARMWLGEEDELLALDLAARGWWLCWLEDVVIHAPSRLRDPGHRRRMRLRNTLWTLWLRRPLPVVFWRTVTLLSTAPADRTTAGALLDALRGLPWVLRERAVVPTQVESGLRLLEQPRRPAERRVAG